MARICNLERGRVAQSAEHRVDRKTPGMAPVVDAEVEGATPSPAHPLSRVGEVTA